jgi:hypothetical protein
MALCFTGVLFAWTRLSDIAFKNWTCSLISWRFQMKSNYRMWLMPLLSIMMLAGCEKNGDGIISPEAVTFPKVSSTNPVNAATEVVLTQPISATFSKTMDGATLTKATFNVMQGTTSIPGVVSCSGMTATFKPDSALTPKAVYTAMITTGAGDLAGKALAVNYVWSFTTGETSSDFRPW